MREMLDGFAAKHPGRFKVWYTLDRPPKGWAFSTGFISEDMIAERLPGPQVRVGVWVRVRVRVRARARVRARVRVSCRLLLKRND